MASKINTDSPKHHKYVDVNKYERKKIIIKRHNSIYNFINNCYNYCVSDFSISYYIREIVYGLKYCGHRFKYINDYKKPYFNKKGCKIVFDDCNHKTYRVIKNNSFINKIFKSRYYGYRYYSPQHFRLK